MHPMLNIAIRAARQAGNVIARSFEHVDTLTVTTKSHNDFVSEVDRKAEEEIIRVLRKAYPDHAILAEESGRQEGHSEYQWVIDPLDGTTNFLHGMPHFAVSIGLFHKGRPDQAVVYNPINQELYTASRGGGAQLNGRRIRVSNRPSLGGALLGTGFPFKNEARLEPYLNTFRALFGETAGVRRPGAASLDLAYVAAGRFDGFWEFDLNLWDIAAGVLLVQEAGGLVSDVTGADRHLETGHLVAANPKVFKEMLKAIYPQLPPDLRG